METVTATCDLHETTTPATDRYTVTADGVTVVVDVCAEHGAPFRLALERGSRGPRGKRAAAPSRVKAHAVQPFQW